MFFISKTPLLNAAKRSIFRSRFFFCERKKKQSPYVIVRAKPEEYRCIQELLWRYYYPFEPTTVALGLGRRYNPIFDDHAEQTLSEGLSIVAKCRYTGDIVGASLNKTVCPWDPDILDELACSLSCHKTRDLMHFYAYLQRLPCLWEKYCVHKLFEMQNIFVRKSDSGKGIGILLTQASRILGTDCGYRVIRVDATSAFTARICEKLKFKLEKEIPYCSYTAKGPAYEPLLKAPPPHTSVKVYVDTPFAVPPRRCLTLW